MFELHHFSFGERLSFDVVGDLIFAFDNPLDAHATIVSAWPTSFVKVFKIGRNIIKILLSIIEKVTNK